MQDSPPDNRALSLHRSSIVIDGTSFFCEGYSDYLERSGVTALNLTVPDIQDDEAGALRAIASHHLLAQNDERITIIEQAADIPAAKRDGKVGIIIGFQNARPLNYCLPMVELFYRLGVRIVQLTYNDRNFAGDGVDTDADAGLTREGRQLIREMGRVGMVLDLSHVGELSALEALDISEQPLVFTHSNPRARSPIPRNITDEQIRKVADLGGVIGLTPHPPLNWNGGPEPPLLNDFLDNVEYVVDMVGVDHVGIATDSEATPGAYPREVRRRLRSRFSAATGGYKQLFAGREDALHLGPYRTLEDLPVITAGLLERNWDEDSVRRILGLNFLRVFQQVWR